MSQDDKEKWKKCQKKYHVLFEWQLKFFSAAVERTINKISLIIMYIIRLYCCIKSPVYYLASYKWQINWIGLGLSFKWQKILAGWTPSVATRGYQNPNLKLRKKFKHNNIVLLFAVRFSVLKNHYGPYWIFLFDITALTY